MRALVAVPSPPHVELGEAPEPQPLPHQALVAVRAFSLNLGETRNLGGRAPGEVPGWDVAGVVERAAADGSGPPAGARVVGILPPAGGGWAERAAVATASLAALPDAVSDAQAATLPVAGLTALKAFDIAGSVLGRRVLVTGASGGVGRFAIQLGRLAGAHVTALARRAEGLADLGAEVVVSDLDGEDTPFDVVVDAMGGATLGRAIGRLAPRGVAVSFAQTTPEPVAFSARDLFASSPGARLVGLYIFEELAHGQTGTRDFARLLELVADGRVQTQIGVELDWSRTGEAVEALLDRRVAGKAVLRVG